MTTTTLCYIENEGKYLMLHRVKKHNDINQGKWIGVGGHVERQETPEECLVREVKEETGLTLTSYKFRGVVTFIYNDCESELMCVFTADRYTGELLECNEGDLQWVDKALVPALPTWEGDKVFLNLLLSGDERFFSIKLQYEGDRLIDKKINLYEGKVFLLSTTLIRNGVSYGREKDSCRIVVINYIDWHLYIGVSWSGDLGSISCKTCRRNYQCRYESCNQRRRKGRLYQRIFHVSRIHYCFTGWDDRIGSNFCGSGTCSACFVFYVSSDHFLCDAERSEDKSGCVDKGNCFPDIDLCLSLLLSEYMAYHNDGNSCVTCRKGFGF